MYISHLTVTLTLPAVDIRSNPHLPPKATGVSDVNEVIQKMVSQESTAESLMILTKENQVRSRKHIFAF